MGDHYLVKVCRYFYFIVGLRVNRVYTLIWDKAALAVTTAAHSFPRQS